MDIQDIKKLEWQLYIERLQHYYHNDTKEDRLMRIESELKAAGRLVNYMKNPPNILRHRGVSHWKRRETLIKAIGRTFDIIDEMNRLIERSGQ